MADKVYRYVEEQLNKGYSAEAVRSALLKSGYTPQVVDDLIVSVTRARYETPSQVRPLNPNIGKIAIVVLIALALIGGGIFAMILVKPKEALLDVKTTQDRQVYHAGESAGFDMEIFNMGSTEKVDIVITYKLLDSDEIVLYNKEESIAVQTSASHHRSVKLPSAIKPGRYEIKVFAIYAKKVATSSFSFRVEEKNESVISKGTCNDNLKNQDETQVDCGGVCGGYFYNGKCNDEPQQHQVVDPTPGVGPTCTDGIKNQNELGVDCAGPCPGYWYDLSCHIEPKKQTEPVKSTAALLTAIRLQAKTDPEGAKAGCLGFSDDKTKDACLKSVAQASMKSEYCELIIDDDERDLCYYPFFMQGDYTVCEKLVLKESLQTCAQLRQLSIVQQKLNSTTNQEVTSEETM